MEMWKHKFEIKKDRWVHVPTTEIAEFGKKLHKFILKKWKAPLYYYHLRDGGHVMAARSHLMNEYFSLIDISNFFESTSQSRVTRELKKILPYINAREISKLSTVRVTSAKCKKFSLPYGFPQSPVLASLCLFNSYAGTLLHSLSKEGSIQVSIYMDDIILSGRELGALETSFELVCNALVKSRYEINQAKTQRPSRKIIAFNLELSHRHLKVTSVRLVAFLQAYAQSKNEFEKTGIATYVHSVSPEQARLHFPKK
ncbi:reverse transcriptase domain-containing protein [Erwinia rhapontici]|uniref:reverse transcriptase domain-containing protein n=1 Tax=Erwinia rhapontici TaxID=55212 RepID=UPI003BA29719